MTARWQVVCVEYATPPVKDRARAERQLVDIKAAGHCRHAHQVVEVPASVYPVS